MSKFTLNHVTILGAGTMGAGIAQWFAQNHIKVQLVDTKLSIALEAHKKILLDWQKLVTKGKFTEEQVSAFEDHLLVFETSQMDLDTDLLIEAIIEDPEIKIQVLKELDDKLLDRTIMATNTSSLSVTMLSGHLSFERQKRFLGLHFFNPAQLMKLVEVIPTDKTELTLCTDLEQWFNERGKVAARCQDSPGFIVNRVARNYYGESIRIHGPYHKPERCREIDEVMTRVGGFKMGPFALMDLIGLDINLAVSRSVWHAFQCEPRFQPTLLQTSLVESGKLGRKTKKGFYDYE
jgi:3-hydroxybutyryl-CoA dehydrogenase